MDLSRLNTKRYQNRLSIPKWLTSSTVLFICEFPPPPGISSCYYLFILWECCTKLWTASLSENTNKLSFVSSPAGHTCLVQNYRFAINFHLAYNMSLTVQYTVTVTVTVTVAVTKKGNTHNEFSLKQLDLKF